MTDSTELGKVSIKVLIGCHSAMSRMADARDSLDRLKRIWFFSDEDRIQLDKTIEMIQDRILEMNSYAESVEKALITAGMPDCEEYERPSDMLDGKKEKGEGD